MKLKTKLYWTLFFILASTVTRCISISAFATLLGISIEITSSAIVLKICAITVAIKNHKSIIKIKEEGTWWNNAASKI